MKNEGAGAVHSTVLRPPRTAANAVVLLDSRDSFTWNLAQAFMELGAAVDVVDADDTHAAAITSAHPSLVCIGPGPRGATPHLVDTVRALLGAVPLLGVCLGMQALAIAAGGAVARARAPVHGKRDRIEHDGAGVMAGLPSPLWVMRYHSLVVTDVPARFAITARDAAGQPMAFRDPAARVEAVQFHPESIGTAGGMRILANAIGVGDVVQRAGAVPPPSSEGPGFSEALYGHAQHEAS